MEMSAIDSPYPVALERTLDSVRERMAEAAARSGRSADAVTLVAVTKGHPLDAVRAALDAGLCHLGENRVEELQRKASALVDTPGTAPAAPIWHLIGHLQRRKAPVAAGLFHLFHAVDSVRLAQRLSTLAVEGARTLRTLVQINASGEGTKGGLPLESALDDLGTLLELPGLQVEGLMTMAPFTMDEHILRDTFQGVRLLHERARRELSYTGTELSMGMTNDFEIGIEEGSTLIRLGTALFGERQK